MNSFTGKLILITGGSGFLATNLIQRLGSAECRIIRLLRPGSVFSSLSGMLALVEDRLGDVRERSTWAGVKERPDFIFHFAAQTNVYTADQDPIADWHANVLPMLHLLETCRKNAWRPGVFFAGTATQIGLPASLPVNETQPDRPATIYDHHKIAAEAYLEHYVRQGWARGATLRLANIYGPGPCPASGKRDRGILNLMMRRALNGEALTLYGEGRQMRDYLFVTDAVDAFLAAAAHADAVNGQHFVLASGEGYTLAQAFQLVAERAALLTGRQVPVTSVAPPAGLSRIEDRSFVGDISRLRAATGWEPRTTLSAGIDLTLQSIIAEQISQT